MKYLSIDFETTGLDPKINQPLSFCGIIDSIGNTTPVEELPKFECYFVLDTWTIHWKAAQINKELIRRLVEQEFDERYIKVEDFKHKFRAFMVENEMLGRVTIAGKNPSFDKGFAEALGVTWIEYRMLDPAMYYLRSEDERIPGLATCLKRAGFSSEGVHDAAFDAKSIIRLMRNYFK